MNDPSNTLFDLAADFINYTNRSVFLTGKAGTGKTTFLKHIKKNSAKETAVVAPTGVAAINAGGVTIHSFFQLPFTPFVPGYAGSQAMDKHHLLGRLKITRERRQILQKLELLIVDEISMVRCDVLDAMDMVLRHFRNRWNEPFGGVQMLLIGDMFQLPPVVSNDEKNILDRFYNSPYFFDSRVLQQQQFVHIELDKIYRQNEPHFIGLLNKIRNNEMDSSAFNLLHKRLDPSFQTSANNGYIILTTHNNKADAVNAEEIATLEGEVITYKAEISGEFYEKSYPAEELLQLKVGAQVMFLKNDAEKVRRYYNGKIGIVTKLEDETIHVQCKDEKDAIEVKRETWENLRYSLNGQTKKVEEEVIGSFKQFPLRLAWAITIHKSQGLTFDKVIIDAGAAFAPGQVYVALSRCTSFSGIILKTGISERSLKNDERIVQFSKQKHVYDDLMNELHQSKRDYEEYVLKSLFDFSVVITQINEVKKVVEENAASFNTESQTWLNELADCVNSINETGIKFQPHLKLLLQEQIPAEKHFALQGRLKAAANYFTQQLNDVLNKINASIAVSDSKQAAYSFNNELKELHTLVALKLHEFIICKNGFLLDDYAAKKKEFIQPAFRVNAYAAANNYSGSESPHPELEKKLRQLRNLICEEKDLPVYLVASSSTINEMTEYLPLTKDDLSLISGFGKAKTERFGSRFLEVINDYCKEKNLSSLIEKKSPKRQRKEKPATTTDTKQETYKLFKEGRGINEIATERKLATGTIEQHFAYFVQKGLITIEEILAKEKILLIESVAKEFEGGSITPLKEKLGEDVSYGEIRLVLASLSFEKNKINT
ncbi:MAG: helix-turn-helix domain-containing protein [Ilyomonas sp.]